MKLSPTRTITIAAAVAALAALGLAAAVTTVLAPSTVWPWGSGAREKSALQTLHQDLQSVSRDIAAVEQKWGNDLPKLIEDVRANHLARLQAMEQRVAQAPMPQSPELQDVQYEMLALLEHEVRLWELLPQVHLVPDDQVKPEAVQSAQDLVARINESSSRLISMGWAIY